jgi:HD-GYP domain-containing protein (c-di-GMP phosphodiesterase class II)
MSNPELRAESLVALAFLIVAVPLAVLAPAHGGASALTFLLFVLLYAVTSRVEFDVGSGYSVPTQLVLVPMLFALPPGWVPLLVAVGGIVSRLPSYLSRSRHPDRSIVAIANGWDSIGAAMVFVLLGLTAPHWSDAPLLILALAGQFACGLVATIAREGLRQAEFPRLSLRLLGPVYLTDLCLAPVGLAMAFAAVGRPAAALLTLPLIGLLQFFARDRRVRMETALELGRAYRGTALLLGDVVGADDAYTGSHSRDVVELSMAVGRRLGLDEDQLRHLEFAALLHDVGKIAISKDIINKPGPLTPEEREVIQTHTLEGETMLTSVGGLLGEVGRIVRSCHERCDGLGYPDGLLGDAIPVEARIVACCDAFNAMTTDRPYRKALPLFEALDELRTHRGTQFDPDVVDCVLALQPDDIDPAQPLLSSAVVDDAESPGTAESGERGAQVVGASPTVIRR